MTASIITSIRNILHWIPIIWKDRDWDYNFLYEILYFKLINMERYLREHGHSTNAEKDAGRIKTCTNLLKRLMDDEYHDTVFKKHDKKWGEPEFNWGELNDKPGYSELKIKKPNVITKEDEEIESNEYNHLMQVENNLRQRDIDYLFSIIKKYHQGWWD